MPCGLTGGRPPGVLFSSLTGNLYVAPRRRVERDSLKLANHKENGLSGQRKGRFKVMIYGEKCSDFADIEAATGIGAVVAGKGSATLLAFEPAVKADAELFAVDRPDASVGFPL